MKDTITAGIKGVLADMGVTDVIPDVVVPENPAHGEYTTNVAMKLAKALKRSPIEIAKEIREKLLAAQIPHDPDDQDQNVSDMHANDASDSQKKILLQDVMTVEVVPPGFVNLFVSEAMLISRLTGVINALRAGTVASNGKRIIVEFTDPNPFKEFHIGHLYDNAVGESLSRLHETTGWEVKRADYFGDVGMHVAKSIWGLKRMLNDKCQMLNNKDEKEYMQSALQSLEDKSLSERVKFLGQAYAMGATAFEDETPTGLAAKEEMKEINLLVFVSAQEYMKKSLGWQPVVDYRKLLPNGASDRLEDVAICFEKGRKWSLDYFETIYARLGTRFDYYYPESIVGEYGAKLVRDHVADGVFTESDGAVVFKGEKFGLHTRVFINSLGLPTYEAKELGLNFRKYQEYPFDKSIIVTGKEIDEYFKVLLTAMKQIIPEVETKTTHVSHGMVRLPEGKMSSRTGKIVTGEGMLHAVKQKIYDFLETNSTNYDKKMKEMIAEKSAVAAIKYSFLKVSLPADIMFDIEKSISFEGDSGPYLQYTYARCRSVLRKAGKIYSSSKREVISSSSRLPPPSLNKMIGGVRSNNNELNESFNPEEHNLARLLTYFPEVVAESAATLSPSTLCTYLYHVAQTFNLFYAKHAILEKSSGFIVQGSEEENVNDSFQTMNDERITHNPQSNLRLTLTEATSIVLSRGLYLLGIETLEQM